MKPYYEKDNITIYCADARDVLPTLGKCSGSFDHFLERNHGCPISDPSPTIAAFHGTPKTNCLFPNGIIFLLLSPKRKAGKQLDQFLTICFAVNGPYDTRARCSASADVRLHIADVGSRDYLFDNCRVVLPDFQREAAGIIATRLGSVNAKASFSIDKTCYPVSKTIAYHDYCTPVV